MPKTSFQSKMLWKSQKALYQLWVHRGTNHFIPNVFPGNCSWLQPLGLHPMWQSYPHPGCGINVHLRPQLVLMSVTSEGLRILVQENPYVLFNEETERTKLLPCSAPAWKLFPSLSTAQGQFSLGAAKELKVTKSWQFTVPWRASQKAKWKWDCFHIRPLYLEDRIQTVWICGFTVHLGNPHKVQWVFFSPSSQNDIKNTSCREL